MADIQQLSPEHRCCVLVGQFLQQWSGVELTLHDAIGAALNIEYVQLNILCSNIHFRDKADILRTLVDVSFFSDDEKAQAKAKIRKLGNHARRRNMIAHTPFKADELSGGARFFTIRAKGSYEAPAIVWTPLRFEQEERALKSYCECLDDLAKRFKQRPLTPQRYANALMPFLQAEWHVPTRRIMSPDLLNSLSQLGQDRPGYGPAKEEKSAQTPDKPQERE